MHPHTRTHTFIHKHAIQEKYDGEVAQLEAKMQNDMALIIMDRDKARQEADVLEEKINELERAAAGALL